MIIWGAFLLSIVCAFILYRFFTEYVVWWELILPPVLTVILIVFLKWGIELSQVTYQNHQSDLTEYTVYYEKWDEYIHKTCTRTDSEGNVTTYDCSYVDTHYPYWTVETIKGYEFRISQDEYNRLKNLFGNSIFVDMRRNYHRIDGDAYRSRWDGSIATSNTVYWNWYYENRVKASNGTVFNYQEISNEDVIQYQLYEYPTINSNLQSPVFLDPPNLIGDADKVKFSYLSGKFGSLKNVRLLILIYVNQPIDASFYQEWYWKGSNFNDFIITIGVNDSLNVNWARVISWTDNEYLKVSTKSYIENMDKLNLNLLYTNLDSNLTEYSHRDTEYFKYIPIEIPTWGIIMTYIFVILMNVGIAAWIIHNEHNA